MSQQSHPYRTNRDLFSNHYLNEHLRQTEPWEEVDQDEMRDTYEEIRELWEDKKHRVEDYNESSLEDNFIRPMFDILGIPFEVEQTVQRNARRPDYGFFPSSDAGDAAYDRDDFYEEAIAVADAKRWGRKLDTRGKEKRDFENPSYQIHRYLQETPPQWAVLTNGEKWRLYYGPTSHRLDSFYEIDLPELLDIVDEENDFEAFKEFYLFFRQEAFLPDKTGDCFLDDIYDESNTFAEALGEDLQENIYEAIRVLAEGFLDTNDDLNEETLVEDLGFLDKSSDFEQARLDLIHDSSLIYLYRLIFVLYAESEGRNLLPTDNEIYSGSYSINELKQEVVENRDATQQHYQTWQTELWDQLDELFVLIDQGSQGQGIPKKDLYIPAYNGGLFRTSPDEDDSVESQFLSNYEVGDAYIAEVIELLTRHEADKGKGKVFVDYSSLDERNLGSIYEGLLEYKLDVADEPLTVDDGKYTPAEENDDIAVETGDVYLRTDDGERKATGSYYTPEYVVEYIVDETLGPLVDEIQEDLMSQSADTTHSREGGFADEFAGQIFDLTVLDPAMGSGHFPVNAVDYLARKIIDAQEKQDRQAMDAADAEVRAPTTEDGELRDINWARRKVAQRCIYGVDVNPLATELAKVSLWLRTLAAEQPLAFLDHHLKTGNSLVGSDIEDVLSDSGDGATEDGQLTLQQSFDHTRRRAMEHVTDRFQDLLNIDNETLEDAKEMEAVYEDVRADPLYKKLLAMANVHTAEAFGLDVPSDADEQMARALHSDAWEKIEQQDWFKSAQAMADDERFFHWELEFPIAFYDEDGERRNDAGFDAVIGNPPWMDFQMIDKPNRQYQRDTFVAASEKYDLYTVFVEKGLEVLKTEGEFGFIVQNKFLSSSYGESLREYILDETSIRALLDFEDAPIFGGTTTYPLILLLSKSDKKAFDYVHMHDASVEVVKECLQDAKEWSSEIILDDVESNKPWIFPTKEEQNAVDSLRNTDSKPLKDITTEISTGIKTNLKEAYVFESGEDTGNVEEELLQPVLDGGDIGRFSQTDVGKRIIYPYTQNNGEVTAIDLEDYPGAQEHLHGFKEELADRLFYEKTIEEMGKKWFEFPYASENLLGEKVLFPDISPEPRSTFDNRGDTLILNTAYGAVLDEHSELDVQYICALFNSSPLRFMFTTISPILSGGYYRFQTQYVGQLPIKNISFEKSQSERQEWIEDNFNIPEMSVTSLANSVASVSEGIAHEALKTLAERMRVKSQARMALNLDLLDYLGNYTEGPDLPEIGLFQPTEENILDATTKEYEKLQIEHVRTKRDGASVTIEATARYKPEDEDEFETDTYGYTETEFFKAFTLTNLSEEEAALVEAFVPVAVEEETGGFSDGAGKTISLMDRLKNITLPDPDDVADDLQRYIETKKRADELDEKIEKTDRLIDEIVYDLYDLTDEEIEIVEEAVADD